MRDPVIVAYGRSAVGKAPKGRLRYTRTASIAAQVIRGLMEKAPQLSPDMVEELVMGCAFPEAEQGLNIGRIAASLAGLPDSVAAQSVNRFCASGVQTLVTARNSIMAGDIDIAIAGGAESMSLVPGGGNMNLPEPELMAKDFGHYMSMGITAENVAEKYDISRDKQDKFALASHQKAEFAQKNGYFKGQIVPIQAMEPLPDASGSTTSIFDQDEGIRYGATLEAIQKLKPIFKFDGGVTAGNSSQTSDAAGFVLMMTKEKAEEFGLRPLARITAFAVVGVQPSIMGIGPLYAIPKVLSKAWMTIKDIDLIELNEAFASQSIACIEQLKLPEGKVNVNGGAIALGHPLGGSGAVLTAKLLAELARRRQQFGMVSMCVGGGMGVAVIFEAL